jgi:hypothetical protein
MDHKQGDTIDATNIHKIGKGEFIQKRRRRSTEHSKI